MENETCKQLAARTEKELLNNILPFWLAQAPDQDRGGFWARISPDLQTRTRTPKGLVLSSRILWAFSAASRYYQNGAYLEMADRAFQEITTRFLDQVYGGMFWMLDEHGAPLEANKKIYGQAFAIYSLVEYYFASKNPAALQHALALHELIEKHHYDASYSGYLETTKRDWSATDELRLSDVDLNEKKSMNSHLHMLEAYTQLYRAWPNIALRGRLVGLVNNFIDHIIDPNSHHLILFFDERWQPKSKRISFGHDIETSWMLDEAAGVLADPILVRKCNRITVAMANVVLNEGMNSDGGVLYEKTEAGELDRDVHWWVQAEAVVGFTNAFQNSGQQEFLRAASRAWDFIEAYLVDHTYGEWFYKVNNDKTPDATMNKVSEWKCPYHNTRACLELLRRTHTA
jgi:mannobiose 2-epimerase